MAQLSLEMKISFSGFRCINVFFSTGLQENNFEIVRRRRQQLLGAFFAFFLLIYGKYYSCKIKNFLYFWKWSILSSYFSHISGENFLSLKNKKEPTLKKVLIFQEMELSSLKLKIFFYISGQNLQSLKIIDFL